MPTVVGNGSPASYEGSVGGEIQRIGWDDSSRYATADSDGTASGAIEDGYHGLRYSDSVTEFLFAAGSAFVYDNSDRIDPTTETVCCTELPEPAGRLAVAPAMTYNSPYEVPTDSRLPFSRGSIARYDRSYSTKETRRRAGSTRQTLQ